VARDRQRAKQRKARRARNPGPAASQPRRENVPGELDHVSGEVDEFDAALVAGADGEPETAKAETIEPEPAALEAVEPEPAEVEPDDELDLDAAGEEHPEALTDEEFEELEDEVEEEEELETAEDRGRRRSSSEPAAAAPARRPGAAHAPAQKGPARFIAFLRASWAELQRVQWPDRRQVAQATAVVLGFVVIAGAYLGLADRVASEIVDFII
jgi:preprotein translocase subunit SecE